MQKRKVKLQNIAFHHLGKEIQKKFFNALSFFTFKQKRNQNLYNIVATKHK